MNNPILYLAADIRGLFCFLAADSHGLTQTVSWAANLKDLSVTVRESPLLRSKAVCESPLQQRQYWHHSSSALFLPMPDSSLPSYLKRPAND
jgi:hypothetical protein